MATTSFVSQLSTDDEDKKTPDLLELIMSCHDSQATQPDPPQNQSSGNPICVVSDKLPLGRFSQLFKTNQYFTILPFHTNP